LATLLLALILLSNISIMGGAGQTDSKALDQTKMENALPSNTDTPADTNGKTN